MGFYIESSASQTKEQWLEANGTRVPNPKYSTLFQNARAAGMVPVVLVDNKHFSAAGICYSKDEFEAFTDPLDPRKRTVYLVEEGAVIKANPDVKRLLK